MKFNTIAFAAADLKEAQAAEIRLKKAYDHVPPEEADVVVALGGDGFMLQTLHRFMDGGTPIFGMNRGSVGFLMNAYQDNGLLERLRKAEPNTLHPLSMDAIDNQGQTHHALAINEVSVLRETRQAAKLRIHVDGVVRIEELICDGILVATPAGSTAYNLSADGPILPLGSELLAMTPISAFRPRRWRGALLPHKATVVVEVLGPEARPVSAVADFTEVRNVTRVEIREDDSHAPVLLFDPEHNLEERVIKEQFIP